MGRGAEQAAAEVLSRAEAWLVARDVTHVLAPVDGTFFGGAYLRTAEVDGEPAGFCVGVPDRTPHMRRSIRQAEYCVVDDANRASRFLAASFGGRGRILYHELEKQLR